MAAVMLPILQASAVHDTGYFELDGNVAHNSATTPPYDWADLFNSAGRSLVTNSVVLSSAFSSDATVPDTSYFSSNGAGVKDINPISQWGCTTINNPTAKDNLLNAYIAFLQIPVTATDNAGHTVMYIASERQSNNGTSFAGFWLFKGATATGNVGCNPATGGFNGAHQDGDLLLVSDYTNGGASQDVQLFRWTGSAAAGTLVSVANGGVCGSSPTDTMCAIANSASISTPWQPGASTPLLPNTFVETGIDLTKALQGNIPCFNEALAETRSSNQLSATLKDFTIIGADNCVPPTVTTSLQGRGTTTTVVGTSVTDTASLSGTSGTPTGSLTYNLFTDANCTTLSTNPTFPNGTATATVTLNPDGSVPPSPAVTFTVANTKYFWQATYSGDSTTGGRNLGGKSACTSEPLSITPAVSSVTTTPSTVSLTVGTGSFKDTAVVSGGYFPGAPTGTVTFQLYGPFAGSVSSTSCDSGHLLFTSPNVPASSGNQVSATFTSGAYTPTSTGVYQWVALYSGNNNSQPSVSPCGTGGEQVTIGPASPSISTTPSTGSIVVDGSTGFSDTAFVTGGYFPGASPTGTVTFRLYGPFTGAVSCVNSAQPGSTQIAGPFTVGPTTMGATTATYTSPSFVPVMTGVYQWVASYNGNPNNNPVAGVCGTVGEQVTVNPNSPAIGTTPSTGTQVVGTGSFTDTASVTGGYFPGAATTPGGGTVNFQLYGPFAAPPGVSDCVTPVAGYTSTNVSPTGTPTQVSATYVSAPYSPIQSGWYQWVASYNGNINNLPVAGSCGTGGELVHVIPASPQIATTPSVTTLVVDGVTGFSDTASVTNGFNPAAGPSPDGTVTFSLYGPFASAPGTGDCTAGKLKSGPVTQTATTSDATSATYGSQSYVPTADGIYQWVASYNGNSNNNATTSPCGTAAEQVTVGPASPTISTVPSVQSLVVGTASITDTANVANGFFPGDATQPGGGTVTFNLYGPFASAPGTGDCTTPVLGPSSSGSVSGGMTTATYTSPAYTPTEVGIYQWVASYNGNANNNPVAGSCGDASEQVLVQPATPGIASTILLGDSVKVSPAPGAGPVTGTVSFTLTGPYSGTPNCNGAVVTGPTAPVAIDTNGLATTPSVAVGAGLYAWQVTFTSTAPNYTGTQTSCVAEQATIAYQTPSPIG